MIGKSPGMVLCGHCALLSAEVLCAACERMVCTGCQLDWSSCPVTHAGAIDLDGFQLRDVDGTGTFGFVTKKPGLFQRMLRSNLHCGVMRLSDRSWLIEPGRLYWRQESSSRVTREGFAVCGIPVRQAGETDNYLALVRPGERPVHIRDELTSVPSGLNRDDSAAWFLEDNLLQLFDLRSERLQRLPGLPQRLAIQAVDFDAAVGTLVIGTWAKLYVFAVHDKVEPVVTFELGDVDVDWIRFRGRSALVSCLSTTHQTLRLYDIDGDRVERRPLESAPVPVSSRLLCDFSEDGVRMVLAGRGGTVILYDLGTGVPRILGGHDAQLTALRFTDGDTHLVSGDIDGRVVTRPRDGDEFSNHVVDH